MATQCLGRHVRDTPKGVNLLSFENGGGFFHIPIRCEMVVPAALAQGGLCDRCAEKEKKTAEKVLAISGTTIGGMLPSYLMGRVTEPIPYWSRLYDGAWFRLKLESGCILSEETMAKAKAAAAKAYEGVTVAEPAALPSKGRKLKAAPVPVVPVPVVTAPVPVPVKRVPPKKTGPMAVVKGAPVEVETIVQIAVRKVELDNRLFYLDPKKDKLYDLKFKYVGRLKGETIVDYPDSDA